MSRTVTLIRHAETEANAAMRWQGSLNAPISSRGVDQIASLGKRYASRPPRRLISSDLERTMFTAAVLGDPIADPRWREFDVGGWEGLTSEEVRVRFPGQLEALIGGEELSIGGGEHLSAFRTRVLGAFDDLVASLDDGDEAVVVTHGGVIWALTGDVLGLGARSSAIVPPHNTAVTQIHIEASGHRQVSIYNDSSHLSDAPMRREPGGTVVSLFRHGQTEGNVAGRWQGRTDSPLTELGRWQARAATPHSGSLEALYTSPLGRTADTATVLGAHHGLEPVPHDGLIEMSFGSWENMTTAEASEADPALFDAIYVDGEDQRRGGDGESFTEAGRRMASTVAALAASSDGGEIGVVSHGAIIRAYVTEVIGIGFVERNRIPIPRNTSMSRVVHGERGVALSSYNVAPHLDEDR